MRCISAEALTNAGYPETFELDFLLDEQVVPHRWLRMRGHPEYDRDGLLARVYGVTFDISQHRQHEERLSLSERRYRALVESTGAMVWSAGPDGRMYTN